MEESDLVMSAGYGLDVASALAGRENMWLCPTGRLGVPCLKRGFTAPKQELR